jgi:ATP-binding cassette subfamily B protein
MTSYTQPNIFTNPIKRILSVIRLEKKEITSLYFYAVLNGLIQLSLPLGIQAIISFVLGGVMTTSIVVLIFFVVLGVFFNGMLQVNQMRLIEKVQQKLFVRYSFEFSERIPKLNLHAVNGYYLPELVNRFFDTVTLQKSISKLLLDIPTATIQILFGLVLLSFYNSVFILFGLILVLIVYFILRTTSAKGLDSSIKESSYKFAVAGWLQEMARAVKSFKLAKHTTLSTNKTDKLVTGYLQSRTTHFKVLEWQYWSLVCFKVLITLSMLTVGSILLVNQQLNIGQFIASEIVILLVISSVEKLIINLESVYDVLTSVEKLGKITDEPLEEEGMQLLADKPEGVSVQLSQVFYHYDEQHRRNDFALKDINLVIEKNEKVCIMGPDGSGKSTLLSLISGELKPLRGSLRIDNHPASGYQLQSLRAQTGILFSQQEIFEGTLMENITMGWPDITVSHIMEMAEIIGLKEFIHGLPDGVQTLLYPAGKQMSQKTIQKILLLRAIIDHPRLVLLEDPLQGVEEDIQQRMMNYLLYETPGQTLLVISNDEKLAARCDKVVYMQHGMIKASGKWDKLKPHVKSIPDELYRTGH